MIHDYRFGHIEVDGHEYSCDVVLLRGEVLHPWWRRAGGHVFAPEDLEAVIAAAPEVVVLGTGAFGRVRVLDETLEALRQVGSRVVVAPTADAVAEVNRLTAAGADVVAALHLTC